MYVLLHAIQTLENETLCMIDWLACYWDIHHRFGRDIFLANGEASPMVYKCEVFRCLYWSVGLTEVCLHVEGRAAM